jgi:hypothetical protein
MSFSKKVCKWQWDDGTIFVDFDKVYHDQLEQEYKKNKNGQTTLTIFGKQYLCTFSDMQQTNLSTQFKRKIKRFEEEKKKDKKKKEIFEEEEEEETNKDEIVNFYLIKEN